MRLPTCLRFYSTHSNFEALAMHGVFSERGIKVIFFIFLFFPVSLFDCFGSFCTCIYDRSHGRSGKSRSRESGETWKEPGGVGGCVRRQNGADGGVLKSRRVGKRLVFEAPREGRQVGKHVGVSGGATRLLSRCGSFARGYYWRTRGGYRKCSRAGANQTPDQEGR